MYLPKPPTDKEKYLYLESNRFNFYGMGVLSMATLTLGMLLFALRAPLTYIFLIPTIFTAIYLGLNYIIGLLGEDFDFYEHALPLAHLYETYPNVDVYLPCCNEPLEIIKNTYQYVRKLKYQGRLNIYVLDDGYDPEIEVLAKLHSFHYLRRDNPGEMKKAGNLRAAFKRTSGELIAIFDADFCPREDFLSELVPHFLLDKTLAIAQSPQFFTIDKTQTFLEKGACYIQELFYRMVQVSRNTVGGSICVGTNAVYRRSALEPFGGTAEIGYSEDVHTGFNVVNAGWKISYIPINLAKGVCPGEKSAFFLQQYRWAMGSITLMFSRHFWESKLTVLQKICYLSGQLYYVATGVGVLLAPLPGIIMAWAYPDYIHWYNWLFVIPSLAFGTLFMASWTKGEWGFYAIIARHISNFAHLFALRDFIKKDLVSWIPTGSISQTSSTRVKSFVALNLIIGITTFLLCVIGAVLHMKGPFDLNFLPLILFSILNLVVTIYAHETK